MNKSLNVLVSKIEQTRMELTHLASRYGYCSPIVVQCSQELDLLLYDYQIATKH